MVNYSW